MSLINPIPQQTVIKFYKGVVWDNTYKDIRWFSSVSQRTAYFNARLTDTFENCSIAKPGRAIRVQGSTEHFLKCNYLSWRNVGLTENREYYAFITAVNYVNVNTVEIEYEVDWIQSYLFDFVFEAFLVERMHTATDNFGEWREDENLDTGEIMIENIQDNTYPLGVKMSFLSQAQDVVNPKVVGGVVSGINWTAERLDTGLSVIKQQLTELNNNGEANEVAQFVMICADMIGDTGMHKSFNVNRGSLTFTFGSESYTAKNRKLQLYPYKFMTIDNYEGGVEQFKYEEFPDDTCAFAVEGTMHPKPCMICFPIDYKGWTGNPTTNNGVQQFSVLFVNFPEVAWTSDTFRAWVSQNSVSLLKSAVMSKVQVVSGGLQAAAGITETILSGGLKAGEGVSTALQGVGNIVNGAFADAERLQDIKNHAIHGENLQGSLAMAGMSYFRNTVGFRVTQYCLHPAMAKRIDDFFTRYGYRVDRLLVPNVNSRQYCNYIKGAGAIVGGDISEDAKLTMERALNSGVTFWHTDNIGMTLTENPIIGG